jgi:fatty acid desaturase
VQVLPSVDAIDRSQLQDELGRAYKEFKRGLTPRWARVWIDIGAGYLALGATAAALAWLQRSAPRWLPLWVALAAIVFGYAIAFVQLFFHEAAHFNIAPGRALNDRLANLFIGWMVGQEIKCYRIVHFDHHRYLGTPRDTERSYFDALDRRFVVEGLIGIKLLRVVTGRANRVDAQNTEEAVTEPADRGNRRRRLGMLAAGGLVNLAIIAAAVWTRNWGIALAWPLGMILVHPFINAVRQLLEHRGFDARADVDYSRSPHGAVTRMFGAGPLASTMGGAGFNRHLLHHWEAQISYTRLGELEDYLSRTPAADVFRREVISYPRAFRRLWRAS